MAIYVTLGKYVSESDLCAMVNIYKKGDAFMNLIMGQGLPNKAAAGYRV